MASPTKTPPPPLFTADNVEMTLGMLVYGVDTHCRNSTMPIIEPLLVVALDLGVNREVRLRRERGTEWRWSAADKSDTCRTADQFIYASYDVAKQAIGTITDHLRHDLELTLQDANDAFDFLEEDYKETLTKYRKDCTTAEKALSDFDKQIQSIVKSKAPKNPFTNPKLPEPPPTKTKSSKPKPKITRKRRPPKPRS